MHSLRLKLEKLLVSRGFFWGVVIFFVLEALWFVVFAAYPLAFDERYHFGLIQIYAQHWLPFLDSHPPGADQFGIVARDPSYLFHYLMSFPYRLIALVTDSQIVQVILLRLVNTAMFTGGLLLFARLLRRAGSAPALTNTALAIFVLVPIVPHLAATINYDNLFFLLLPGLLLTALKILRSLQKQQVDIVAVAVFIIGSLLLGIVKLASLPLLVAVAAYLIYVAVRLLRGHRQAALESIRQRFRTTSKTARIGLLITFVIAFGLFFQRYGVNLATYASPSPDCSKVLTVEQCLEYGPWARNFLQAQANPQVDPNPFAYSWEWLWGMWFRSFFAVSGVDNNFDTKSVLPVPGAAGVALAVLGVVAIIACFRATFRGQLFLQLLTVMSVFYIAVLWLQLYSGYLTTGHPNAINGRYLIPILLPLAAVMGRALGLWWQKKPALKTGAAAVTILLFLYGGGIFTYIIRSDQDWLWQHGLILQVSETVRGALSLVIIH